MTLHRYFGSHAFETLKETKLKTSRISSFNDSFEFLYFTTANATPEAARAFARKQRNSPGFLVESAFINQTLPHPLTLNEIDKRLDDNEPVIVAKIVANWPDIFKQMELSVERRREVIDQELRAICFSDPSRVTRTDEILLWSHYANRSQGIRIGFDFPAKIKDPFELFKIAYNEKRVEVVFHLDPESAGSTLEALQIAATAKSKAWEYEREFRLLTKVGCCEPMQVKHCGSTTIEHFLAFDREWVTSVDFGVFCRDTEIQPIVDYLKTAYPNVTPRKAMFSQTEYALEYKQVQ